MTNVRQCGRGDNRGKTPRWLREFLTGIGAHPVSTVKANW